MDKYMYKKMLLIPILLFCCIFFATDEATRKTNEQAALQRWLSCGKQQELGLAFSHFNTAFEEYCNTYRNVFFDNVAPIQEGQKLLKQLCCMPSYIEHEGLYSIRENLINELQVRLEFQKKAEGRNYPFLIEHALHTSNNAAHVHMYTYLVNNPSQKTVYLVPYYIEKLSKIQIEPQIEKACRVIIQQGNMYVLQDVLQECMVENIKIPINCIAEELFHKSDARLSTCIDTFIDIAMQDTAINECVTIKSSHKQVMLLKSLLHVAQSHFTEVRNQLSANKSLIIPFMNTAEKLIAYTVKTSAKPDYLCTQCVPWKKKLRLFFNSCFKQSFDEQTRSSLASGLFNKYESNPVLWKQLSCWVCCAGIQYMLVHHNKELTMDTLQRSIEDFAHLFSIHLKKDTQEEGKKFINALYVQLCKKKADKKQFRELFLNTNELVLLASCKPEHRADYLIAQKQFATMSLNPCQYDDVADVIMASLCGTLKKNGLIDSLKSIENSTLASAIPATRALMHFDFRENLQEKTEWAKKLYSIYQKHENKELFIEAEACMKGCLTQGIAESECRIRQKVEDKYVSLFDQLSNGMNMHEELSALKVNHIGNPLYSALKASQEALAYKEGHDNSITLSKIVVCCEEARRFACRIPNSPWRAYITPACKDLIWQNALALCKKTAADTMQLDFDLIGYAIYLNDDKTNEEKQFLLEKTVCKHPFCSLLHVQHALEKVNDTFARMPWEQREKCYHALHYAIMQGQRSQASASSLDVVTQQEVMHILENNIRYGDLASAITCASLYDDINIIAGRIAAHPFKTVMNILAFDIPIDNYIVLADSFKILALLKEEAQKNNSIARSALFRLYFTKLYDAVNSSDAEKYISFIKQIMGYGCNYILNNKSAQKGLVKQHFTSLINKMIEKRIELSFFKQLKNTVEKF